MNPCLTFLAVVILLTSCGGGSSNNNGGIPDDDKRGIPEPTFEALEVKTLPDEVVLFSTEESS
jgi:hypothetical protein